MVHRARRLLVDVGPGTVGLTFCVWVVLVISLLRPPLADYGIHVSVAERLIAGDRLYVDVWDNKDPFYFEVLALARWVTPWGGWLVDIGRLVVVGIASYVITACLGGSRRQAVLLGWVAAPVIAISIADPTDGVPPGIALALVSIAFLLRSHGVLGGAALAAVPFFKVTLFPVALTSLCVLVALTGSRRLVRDALLGFVGALAGVVLFMAVRGDLGPYLTSLRLNVTYSQEGQNSGLAALRDHLSPLMSTSVQVTMLAGLLAMVMCWPYLNRPDLRSAGCSVEQARRLWWAAVAGATVAPVVLGVTGKWPGHAKLLVLPAVLAVLLAGTVGPRVLRSPGLAPTVSVLALTVLVAGAPPVRVFIGPIEYARANANLQVQVSSQAKAVLATGSPSTYARVGQGEDPAHAVGLRQWRLACPRFEQYWWESADVLRRTLACLPAAKVLLVTDDLYGGVTNPTWEAYQSDVEALLSAQYACSPEDWGRICVRKG